MKIAPVLAFFISFFALVATAAPPCSKSRSPDLRAVCQSAIAQNCSDIPAAKRFDCSDGLADLPGVLFNCAKGVFNSLIDFAKFIYEIAKLFIDSQMSLIHAELHPVNSANSVAKWSRSHYLSISQTAGYINRELHIAQLRHKGEWFAETRADIDVAKTVAGPLVTSIWGAIEDSVSSKIREFGCYKRSIRAEMLCRVVGDFFVPPAAVFKLVKYGAKAFQEFPNLVRGLEKISNMVKADGRLAKAEEKVTVTPVTEASRHVSVHEKVPAEAQAVFDAEAHARRAVNLRKLKESGYALGDETRFSDTGEVRLLGSRESQLDLFRKDAGSETGQSKINRVAFNLQDKHPVRVYLVEGLTANGRAKGVREAFSKLIYDNKGKVIGTRTVNKGVEIRLNSDYVLNHPEAAYSTLLHETVHSKTLTKPTVPADRRIWFRFRGEVPKELQGYKHMQADELEARMRQIPAIKTADPYRTSLKRQEALDYALAQEALLQKMDRALAPMTEESLTPFKFQQHEVSQRALGIADLDEWYAFRLSEKGKADAVDVQFVVDSSRPKKEQLSSQVKNRLAYIERTKTQLQKPMELTPVQAKLSSSSVFVSKLEKEVGSKVILTPEITRVTTKPGAGTFGSVVGNQIRITQRFFNERAAHPDNLRTWIDLASNAKLEPSRLSRNIILRKDSASVGNLEGRLNKVNRLKAVLKVEEAKPLEENLRRDVQLQESALKSVTPENVHAGTYELETSRMAIVRVPLDDQSTLDFLVPKGKDLAEEIQRQVTERLQTIDQLKEKMK